VTAEVSYRDIPGYPGYRVGSDGTVWSCRTLFGPPTDKWHPLKLCLRPGGVRYRTVRLRAEPNGKPRSLYVHRLVLEAFVGPCPAGMEACHADGDPENNTVGNLRWDTRTANHADKARHGTLLRGERVASAKVTAEKIREVFELRAAGLTQTAIGRQIGLVQTVVGGILRGERWKHVMGEWRRGSGEIRRRCIACGREFVTRIATKRACGTVCQTRAWRASRATTS
jgi:hypothetical protein